MGSSVGVKRGGGGLCFVKRKGGERGSRDAEKKGAQSRWLYAQKDAIQERRRFIMERSSELRREAKSKKKKTQGQLWKWVVGEYRFGNEKKIGLVESGTRGRSGPYLGMLLSVRAPEMGSRGRRGGEKN